MTSLHNVIKRLSTGHRQTIISNNCHQTVVRYLMKACGNISKGCSSKWTSWWRHEMETFSALLALCVGNSPVTGEFPSQRPMTQSFDVVFDLHPNKSLSKQSRHRWFETPSPSLWRHCNASEGCQRAVKMIISTCMLRQLSGQCQQLEPFYCQRLGKPTSGLWHG